MQTRYYLPLAVVLLVLACVVPFHRTIGESILLVAEPDLVLAHGVFDNDPQLMKRALRHGANVNRGGSYAGRTPLMVAAIHGRVEATQFLLAHGADPKLTDRKGLSALALAKQQGREEVARIIAASVRD
jgi:hypothetical protein